MLEFGSVDAPSAATRKSRAKNAPDAMLSPEMMMAAVAIPSPSSILVLFRSYSDLTLGAKGEDDGYDRRRMNGQRNRGQDRKDQCGGRASGVPRRYYLRGRIERLVRGLLGWVPLGV